MRLENITKFLPQGESAEITFSGRGLTLMCRAYLMGHREVFNNASVAYVTTYYGQMHKLTAEFSFETPIVCNKEHEEVDISLEAFYDFMREEIEEYDKRIAERTEWEARRKEREARTNQRRKEREAAKKKLAADLKELEELRVLKKRVMDKIKLDNKNCS